MIEEGKAVKFTCLSEEPPVWFYEENMLPHRGKSLVINEVTSYDIGNYSCTGSTPRENDSNSDMYETYDYGMQSIIDDKKMRVRYYFYAEALLKVFSKLSH